MPIKSLELSNVGPFRRRPDGSGADGIKLEFDANVNLLIGPNNVGKSTVLQALAAVTAQDDSVINALPRAFQNAATDIHKGYNRVGAEFSLVWANPAGDYRRLWDVLTGWASGGDDFYGFPSEMARLKIGGPNGLIEVDEINWDLYSTDFGYVGYYNPALRRIADHYVDGPVWAGVRLNLETGARESISSSQYQASNDPDDDRNVHAAVAYRHSPGDFNHAVFQDFEHVILEIATGFQIDIGTGVFADDDPSSSSHRKGQSKFSTMDGFLTYPELSHGTRSTLAWVSHFMVGMAQNYYDNPNWKEKPGIFIIDEIDAHLHPSWQRRIIPTLQRHFPNVQIFASTHSPMMVAGLKKGQVHLLKRDETGQVVWSRNEQDIIGWTADEIYRTFMGIDDPTDDRTARHAEELRNLRNKDALTPEDEARMQELRRLVNEDLLAGGWLKAQDERFDEMMRRFMANRMSDLSQDGA